MTLKVYGPYRRADGRQHVVHYDTITKKRTTQSYPRYLMEQHLGRKLEEWEEIDHKDNNPSNDKIENLQILSRQENIDKSNVGPELSVFMCPNCRKEFEYKMRYYRGNQLKQDKAGPYCSRRCAGKIHN